SGKKIKCLICNKEYNLSGQSCPACGFPAISLINDAEKYQKHNSSYINQHLNYVASDLNVGSADESVEDLYFNPTSEPVEESYINSDYETEHNSAGVTDEREAGLEYSVYTYNDGGVYEGEWKGSSRHGYGVLKYSNGDVYDNVIKLR
ncbi:MAG: hypothetical protein IKF42_13225, partial [Mogibacterium sp.]|nr:hypothetical protein [Mogibacterium sp.]